MKRILVSGGWGYGNLGDDAILFETLRLIKVEMPDARLTVLSYDPSATISALKECEVEAEVTPSAHLHIAGDAARKRYGHIEQEGRNYPLRDVMRRANSRLQPRSHLVARKALCDPAFFTRSLDPFLECFRSADVMVMSGGGYMNWRFMDGLVAHSCEMIIANKEGAGLMTAGQSIGPLRWNDRCYRPAAELTVQALGFAEYVSVRDQESSRELSELGIEAPVVPDLALARGDEYSRKPDAQDLTVVVRYISKAACRRLSEKLQGIIRMTGLTPRITISRLWRSDIESALCLQAALLESGTGSELEIPKTVGELEEQLKTSRVVISMNLHGLILSWRAGIPVVAIGSNQKVDAFMKQAGESRGALSLQSAIAGEELEKRVGWALDTEVDAGVRQGVARQVQGGFSTGFQAAISAR